MELVALDLKRSGNFIARTLSYEGVEFRRVRLMTSTSSSDILLSQTSAHAVSRDKVASMRTQICKL